jgi:hypothetical protein
MVTERVVEKNEVTVTKGKLSDPTSLTAVAGPAARTESTVGASETFTRAIFEGALDKVSRPLKGKYADALPSSEEFIRDKRREVELEDR